MKVTWPMVAMATCVLIAFLALLGTCMWGVERGFAAPSIVLVPIGSLFSAVVAGVIAYLRGLMRMPPAPPGFEYKAVPSLSPPPTDAELVGKKRLPRTAPVPPIPVEEDTP